MAQLAVCSAPPSLGSLTLQIETRPGSLELAMTMEHRNDVIHDNIYSTHPPGDKEGGGNRWVWVGIAVGLLILIIVFVLMYKK